MEFVFSFKFFLNKYFNLIVIKLKLFSLSITHHAWLFIANRADSIDESKYYQEFYKYF
jgi:hypothetical protein